jgi:hypothetical protein
LVWLVVADSRRREVDVGEAEREGEARWIAEAMTDARRPVDHVDVLDVLRLHAAYLAAPPPNEPFDDVVHDDDAAIAPGWVSVPDRLEATHGAGQGRSMTDHAGPERPDANSGPA